MTRPTLEVADILRAQGDRFWSGIARALVFSSSKLGPFSVAVRQRWAAIAMPAYAVAIRASPTTEPPDQGLCAGNGFVLEAVNDVLQVYDHAGNALLNGGQAVDLNTFYGYPPAIVRSGPNAGQRGPSITDPSCLYDQAIGRFVHVVLTLDHVGLTASLYGNNHL